MSAQDTIREEAVVDTNNNDSVQPAASDVNTSDGVTGDDGDFTIWQAPADDSAYYGLPAVPRRLPQSDAHGILDDTSIDQRNPPRVRAERREPTPARRRAQQAAAQRAIEANRRAEQEELAAEEEAREREAADNADLAGDALREHQRQQPEMMDVFDSSCRRWAEEDPEAAAEFNAHIQYAQAITDEDVRIYDLLCWFKRAPQSVRIPLNNLARSHREESRLRMILNRYERATASGTPRLTAIQQEAAAGAEIRAEGHGLELEPEMHRVTIGTFIPPRCNTQEQEATLVRAEFQLRRVRLDHEQDPALRWPQCNPFENSLDNSVRQWCRDAYDYYYDENGLYRRAFSDDLAETLAQIQAYEEDIG
jgi:hypothetical protein